MARASSPRAGGSGDGASSDWRATGRGGALAPYAGCVTLRTFREAPARPLTALTSLLLAAGLLAGCSASGDDAEASASPTVSESSASDDASDDTSDDAIDEGTDDDGADDDGTDAGDDDAPEFSYDGEDGSTALDLLLEADPSAEVSGEGENAFVTAIDGVAADPDSEFWALYVNGEMATVGAGSLDTTDEDEITWKLETFTS